METNPIKTNRLEVGDCVRLKSGGPTMTIESIQGNVIHCIWFSSIANVRGQIPNKAVFEEASLCSKSDLRFTPNETRIWERLSIPETTAKLPSHPVFRHETQIRLAIQKGIASAQELNGHQQIDVGLGSSASLRLSFTLSKTLHYPRATQRLEKFLNMFAEGFQISTVTIDGVDVAGEFFAFE